jgi:hypothetical protein
MNTLASYSSNNWHFSGAALTLIIVVALLVLAFEVWMLIDAIKNKQLTTSQKVWWIIGMFLLHPFVAIVYYFMYKLRSNKK